MTDTIDKLVFALGGDISGLNKAYAEAEAGAQKTGTNIKNNLGTGFKDAAAAASQHADALKKAMGEVDGAVKSTNGSVATATREFRALFDELSSGRTRQSPGTLAIIATRVFGISGATLAWSVALAAIPIAFAVAAFSAENALSRVDEALKRTGNQAGITRDQIVSIASKGIPGLSESGALGVLGTLAGRGNIAPNQLANAARAVPGYARATGLDDDKAAAELEKLFSEPSKGASQLNAEFKLLDVATTRQIEQLEAAGRSEEAQAILIKAADDRFGALTKSTWSLASAFSDFGKGLSTFWFKTGTLFTNADQTDAQKLAVLQNRLGGAQNYQARYGSFGPGNNEGVANDLKTLPGEIKALQATMAKNAADVAAGRQHAVDNSAVGFGLKIADSYDEQADKAKKLGEQLSALNIAIGHATGSNAKYREELVRERDAVQTALQNQRSPAQIAEQAASDQRRIAAAAPGHARDTLTAQIAAQREYQRNLSDPKTAPYAKSIFDSQSSTAGLINKEGESKAKADARKAAEEAARMKEHLDALKAEATGARDVANAYAISDAEAVKVKATQEVDIEITKKEIAEKDRLAAVQAKVAKAYADADGAVAKQINSLKLSNAGLVGEAGAGGNPAAIAAAKRAAEASEATKGLSQTDAAIRSRQVLSELTTRDAANIRIAANQTDQALQNSNDMLKLQLSLKYEDSALRAKEIADLETIQELQSAGYEKGTAEYEAEYKRRSALKEAAAALGGDGGGAGQIYTAFRDGLGGVLMAGTNGFKSMGDAASNFLKQLAQMTVQTYLLGPLFNILLGKSGTSGGGLLGGLFSSLTGGLFGGGKASGGQIDPGKFYVVGENGPEIMGPGVAGHVTPMSAPNMTGTGSGSGTLNTNVNATIMVQGNGDSELKASMEAGARAIVAAGIEANNKVLARTQRPKLLAANRRALP